MKEHVILAVIAIIVILALTWFGFWIKRTVNYNLYYREQVQQQIDNSIRSQVLASCLVENHDG